MFSAKGQTERVTNTVNGNEQVLYAITNSQHIYRRTANFLVFLQTVSRYYFTVGQANRDTDVVN